MRRLNAYSFGIDSSLGSMMIGPFRSSLGMKWMVDGFKRSASGKSQQGKVKGSASVRAMAQRVAGEVKPGAETTRKSAPRRGEGKTGRFVFQVEDVGRQVEGDRILFEGIHLAFNEGAKIGILGINGSGKSSFLRILAGLDEDYEGKATPAPGVRVGYLAQEPVLDEGLDVKENILQDLAPEARNLLMELHAIRVGRMDVSDDVGSGSKADAASIEIDGVEAEVRRKELEDEVKAKIEKAGFGDLNRRVDQAMHALRCPPMDSRVDRLSGGERRRVALCRLLIAQPDMLLLDEPTNHLDAESIAWLEHYLDRFSGTVLAVTHDRYFLDNVAGWILEFDRGKMIPFRGNYSEWLEAKARRLESEEKQHAALAKRLKEELTWIQASPKARQTKSRARVQRFQDLEEQAKAFQSYESGRVLLPAGPRLGQQVVEMEGVSKKYGSRMLFEQLTWKLPPGGIVGIVGPNGAGKSTILRMIAGEEQPDDGEVRIGQSVKLGYVLQGRDELDPDESVYESISEGQEQLLFPDGKYLSMRNYVSAFHFHGVAQQRRVGLLSGGERNRVYLARVLKEGYNVLLLDEPTNDLDVEVLRSLEQALMNFAGSAVIVSHDRWFLDRVCTHILALEPTHGPLFYDGNYQDYLRWRNDLYGSTPSSVSKIQRRKLGFE